METVETVETVGNNESPGDTDRTDRPLATVSTICYQPSPSQPDALNETIGLGLPNLAR